MKQIEIDGTKYDIEANALTYFDYERIFKRIPKINKRK